MRELGRVREPGCVSEVGYVGGLPVISRLLIKRSWSFS